MSTSYVCTLILVFSVRAWLESINLESLVDAFLSQGYDDMEVIKHLNEHDLDTLNITLPGMLRFVCGCVHPLQN